MSRKGLLLKGVGVLLTLLLLHISFGSLYWNNSSVYEEEEVRTFEDIPTHIKECLEIECSTQRKKCIGSYNYHSKVLNYEKYPVNLNGNATFVPIVVVSYNRTENLKLLLDSFSRAEGISETTVIISCDGYFEEIQNLIQEYDQFRIKVIFHPNSKHFDPESEIHLHPKTATKHHYWWIWNYLYSLPPIPPDQSQFNDSKDLEENRLIPEIGDILFLEEDLVVLPDFYDVLERLIDVRNNECTACSALNLGTGAPSLIDEPTELLRDFIGRSYIGSWGFCFNRTSFERIKSKALTFCSYNDYNWDWTLTYLSIIKYIPPYSVVPVYTRVFHTGVCGMHNQQNENCDGLDYILNEKESFSVKLSGSSPESMRYVSQLFLTDEKDNIQANQGWTSSERSNWSSNFNRDLCLKTANITIPR